MGGNPRIGGVAAMPVNQIGQQQRTLRKRLAAQERRARKPKPQGLRLPTVVDPFVPPALVYTDTVVTLLARQRRRVVPDVVLTGPVVVLQQLVLGGTMVVLVPRRVPRVRSELKPPEV